MIIDTGIAPGGLINSVRRRMPLASEPTLSHFSDVVYSIAQNFGNNDVGAYKEFLKVMDGAAKKGEDWAVEAIDQVRVSRHFAAILG